MTYLLDANILIALCDELHAHHHDAHRWFKSIGRLSWATCPLTENAFIRITSKPTYPRSTGSVTEQMRVLRELCQIPGHQFWPDDVSLVRHEVWSSSDHASPADLTDLYLVALAVKREQKFATLDRTLPVHRIRGGQEALHLLGI